MSSSQKQSHPLLCSGALIAAYLLSFSAAGAEPYLPSFVDEGKNIVNYPTPNQRMVVLPDGVATIIAHRFKMPKDTMQFPLAGMTMFPYYQADDSLKEFLNNARVGGVPVTMLKTTPNLPQTSLPPTDTIRINIPIPTPRIDKKRAEGLAMRNRLFDEVPWFVAHQTGQSFAVPGDSTGLVILSSGAMFNACAERTLVLKCGTIWVVAGAKPVAVLTKYGAVAVRPFSIAAVEQNWFNKVKAASLHGDAVDFQFAYKGNSSKIEIAKGKEVTLTESGKIASSGISDFVANQKVAGEIAEAISRNAALSKEAEAKKEQGKEPGKEQIAAKPMQVPPPELNLVTRNIDPEISSFVTELKTVNPPISNISMNNAYKQMFANFGITPEMRAHESRRQFFQKNNLASSKTATPTYKASLDSRYFVPAAKRVVTGPVPFPRVAESLKTLWVQHGAVKYLENAKVEVEREGRVSVSSGEAVCIAKEPMYVRANDCFINIDDGAIVEVIARNGTVLVRNLRELGNKSVQVKVKSRTIQCAAGEELLIGDNMPAVFAEMKNDGVSRRNVHSIETAGGTVIINKSEIELTTLMQYSPIMRQIYESKNEHDQKIVSQIVKMDAVLSLVTGKRGGYQRMAGLPSAH